MSERQRLDPEERREQILKAALKLAQKQDLRYEGLTKDRIAEAAECSAALVNARLGPVEDWPALLMKEAVARRIVKVVAHGLAFRHPAALRAPADLKQEAVDWMLGKKR